MQFESLSDLEDLDRLLKIGEERAIASREAPVFVKYSDSDDNFEPFLDCHLGLTITQRHRASSCTGRAWSPLSYLNMTPALWPSH
jgi:hypothetical protein